MLDEIYYSKDKVTGAIIREVTHLETVPDPVVELAAIKAQLSDLESGQAEDPTHEALTAIANYKTQITVLTYLLDN